VPHLHCPRCGDRVTHAPTYWTAGPGPAFRPRPLDGSPYPLSCSTRRRESPRARTHRQRLRRAHNGRQLRGLPRELGPRHRHVRDGAAWLAFLRGLVARGLSGVQLVTSDAHPGSSDAIRSTLTGASWQRCHTHFMRNLLTRVPRSAHRPAATPCAQSSTSPTQTPCASSTSAASPNVGRVLPPRTHCRRRSRRAATRAPNGLTGPRSSVQSEWLSISNCASK
jgi:hypothetical protein